MGEPDIWLRGDRVGLGPYRRDLVEFYWRGESDPRGVLGYGKQVPESLESRTAGIDVQLANSQHPRFTVYELGAGNPVGLTELMVDHMVRSAQFVIVLVPEARGQSFAAEATRLTLDYGFHLTSLRSIWLKVLEHNTAGIRVYENAGFKHAGRLRQAGYWLGEPCDELIMDALASEFTGDSAVRRMAEPKSAPGGPGSRRD
jgi:RimJ/RimL family protein N-acetyltransferase